MGNGKKAIDRLNLRPTKVRRKFWSGIKYWEKFQRGSEKQVKISHIGDIN